MSSILIVQGSIVWPKPPTAATLKKYGLTPLDFADMALRQGGVCYVCGKLPPSKRLCIDHHHAKGWKKMPPSQRRQYVRGLLCTFCNYRLVNKGMTLEKARRVVQYLQQFAEKQANNDNRETE